MILDIFQQSEAQKLTSQLSGYGLDPNDWTVQLTQDSRYTIQSKADQNFIFEGKIRKQGSKISWETIDLVSL